jgi:calcineurin-like phosphoesterase family protein
MGTLWTADLHLGHTRIIELCSRPFSSVEEMNESLIRRWNEVVGPDDRVYVLGDVALGRITQTLPLVARLDGQKLLIPGNHDRCHPMYGPQANGWRRHYLDAGFAEILGPFVFSHRRDVVACHFPPAGDSRDADRFITWRPQSWRGRWHLHGHVHEKWRQRGYEINVGVDAWGGRPATEGEVNELILAGPRDLEPLPW